jgi:cobyrinic acid a,c-diamide synthase
LTLGYREARLLRDGILGAAGTRLRGHEFHYATIAEPGADAPLAEVTDAYGSPAKASGSRRGYVSGSFFHMIAPVP